MEERNVQDNSLSFAISGRSLLKYALPTILSGIFMNVYSLVDSLFVANLVSIEALSAVNIVGPALAIALAVSITMIAMNVILMDIAGSDGVAAAAVVLSAQTLLSAAYMGYLEGIAPVISYNHGAGEHAKLKQIFKAALWTIGILSALTFALSFPAAPLLARIYASDSPHVMDMAVEGIHVFAAAFLLMGVNMFASSMFTAFNDGKTSALLSLLRTLIFLIIPLLILPRFWGIDGVWLSLPMAEVLALAVSVYFFKTKKGVYHYA